MYNNLKRGVEVKKFLLLALAIILLFSLSSCKENGNTAVDDTTESVSGTDSTASVSDEAIDEIDEEKVKLIVFDYDSEITGLSEGPDDYIFKIVPATFNGKAAHKADAFLLSTGELCGVFYVVGDVCYRYDSAEDIYYELTHKKAEEIKEEVQVNEVTETTTQAPSTTEELPDVKSEQDIADENKRVLVSRYEKYDLSVVGLPKPISEYEFQTTNKTAIASDGETVFVIYLMENGAYTDFTFAVGSEKDYYLDKSSGEYKPLS